MLPLNSRCACGVLRSLAAEDPEPHLACNGIKRCRKCRQAKPVSEFYKAGKSVSGRCGGCICAIRRERYASDDLYHAKIIAAQRRSQEKHKVKRMAKRAALYGGLRREKELARKRAYYAKNRTAVLARAKRFHEQHRAYEAAQAKKYAMANPEKVRKKNADYYAQNRALVCARERERYARKKAARLKEAA